MHRNDRTKYLKALSLWECLLTAGLVLSVAGLLVLGCALAARCWDADSYPAQPHWRDDFAATGNSSQQSPPWDATNAKSTNR